jgi:CRISPR-associated protein Cst2
VRAGDVPARELVLGGAVVETLSEAERQVLEGAQLLPGVRAACEAACQRLEAGLR